MTTSYEYDEYPPLGDDVPEREQTEADFKDTADHYPPAEVTPGF